MINHYEDKKAFKDSNGDMWNVVNISPSKENLLLARVNQSIGGGEIFYHKKHVSALSIEILKEVELWDAISQATKDEMLRREETGTSESQQRMSHARNHRRQRYTGIPREVTCSICGETQAISPAQIIKRSEKEGRSVENWIKEWACQRCKPSKGRKANPKYAHLPKELTCACGNKVNTSSTAIVSAAERRKITPEEYVKAYKCQKCGHTKGFKKGGVGRGRKANPLYAHLPKELVCACGKKAGTSVSAILTAAKKRNITPEEFVKAYRCQSCFATKGRKKGKKIAKK